jgi:hypothetical protein
MPANSGTKIHGKGGAIYIGGAKGAGGIRVATKTEWTLQRNRDYVDATVFGDSNKTYLAGLPNLQGTFAGFLDTSGDLLLNAATSDSQNLYLYASDATLAGTAEVLVAHGSALIDANVTVANTDGARITGEFRANGAWTIDLSA